MKRRYKGENIINFRDLGGYEFDGGVTAYGRVFRAGIARDPSPKDLELLKEAGIKTVVDLRGDSEVEDMPSYFKDSKDFDYYHISLLEANPALAQSDITMPEMYEMCLTDYSKNFAEVLRIIASIETPFLFHCFCGKDRTGMLAAMILDASGVDRADIVADYEVSYTYIKSFIEKEIREKSGLIWDGSYDRFYSQAENMEHILNYIDKKYGSVKNYFSEIGLTHAEIEKISNILK